jgi:hypothetical protein
MTEAFLSIIGILVGWLLAEVSASWRANCERRRRLGRALAALSYLNHEMVLLQRMFEKFKDFSSGVSEYERYRQYILKRYPRQDEKFRASLEEASETIAEELPLQSLELSQIVTRYYFLHTTKLQESVKIPELYIFQISSLEVGYDLYQKRLASIVTRLAFRHGIVTGIKHLWLMRKLNRPDKAEQSQLLDLAKQFKDGMSPRTSNESEAQMASSSEQRPNPALNTDAQEAGSARSPRAG